MECRKDIFVHFLSFLFTFSSHFFTVCAILAPFYDPGKERFFLTAQGCEGGPYFSKTLISCFELSVLKAKRGAPYLKGGLVWGG